jgi:hypothetical protein
MKGIRIFLLCTTVAIPQLAMAGLAETSPQGLGIVRAILTFCTQVDPRDAAAFQTEWDSIVGGATSQQLGGLQATSGYKQASDTTTAELQKLSKSDATAKCAAGATQWASKAEPTPGKGGDDGDSHDKHWRAERPEPSSRFPFAPNAP